MPASVDSTSSGTLRGWSHTARADEWLNITGEPVTASASRIVSADVCDRSTSMPRRFISRTTSRPKSVSPFATGSSVAESAQGTLLLWVSVRYRTPIACNVRSTASELSIECPPSAPSNEASLPSRYAASTSSAVSASDSWSG